MRVKVKLADNIARVVFIETDATNGATLGTNLFNADGSVTTAQDILDFLDIDTESMGGTQDHRLLRGLTLGDDHPQYTRKDTLTTRGDLYYRDAATVARLGLGTNLQFLRSTGTDPAWQTVSPTITLGTDLSGNTTLTNLASATLNATIVNNAVTDAKLRDSVGNSVIGRSAATTGDPADIVASVNKTVLGLLSATVGFNAIDSTWISDFNEAAQDAVGGALTDSTTIDFTYSDVGNTITAIVIDDSVTNAKLANMPDSTVMGRAEGAGTGDPTYLTATQVAAILDAEAFTWTGQHTWSLSLRVPDGTVGTPGVVFSADLDTGIYRPAANQIGFTVNGAETVRIESSNLVVNGSVPALRLVETDAAADEGVWRWDVNSRIMRLRVFNDALSLNAIALAITRGTGATPSITDISVGNATDNPTVSFLGTGAVTFGGQIRAADGNAGAPGVSFSGDTNTGVYRIGADNLGLATNGTLRWDVSTTAITSTLPLRGQDGTVSAPAVSFSGDTDTGRYRIGADNIGDAAGGVLQFEIGSTYTDQKTQARRTGVISPTQLTANTDDWNPTGLSTASVIRASTDASRNLTGIQGGVAGRELYIINIGTQPLVLVNDATSTAANRFLLASGTNTTLQANGCAHLWYDGTSSRWRQISRGA